MDKDFLYEIDEDLNQLYANICHECGMGRFKRYEVQWILDTINDIQGKIPV